MICLGIEGSANKVGVGIVKDEEVLANVRKTYITEIGTGFKPTDTAKHHKKEIIPLIKKAIEESGLNKSEIDFIAFTIGPGMAAPLQAMAVVARTLSMIWKKPIIPVNHCIGHIEMGRLITNAKNPVILYVSGGNTQILGYFNKKYRIFGETIDIGVGNCLDRFARILKLSNDPSPGFNLEVCARKGKKLYPLPLSIKGLDLAFSGVLSKLKRLVENQKLRIDYSDADLCFSLQETVFTMLVKIVEKVMAIIESKEILVVGGVGCNLRLQEMLGQMAQYRKAIFYSTDSRFCIDNGAMIAYAGLLKFKEEKKGVDLKDTQVTQDFKTDEVLVSWRN